MKPNINYTLEEIEKSLENMETLHILNKLIEYGAYEMELIPFSDERMKVNKIIEVMKNEIVKRTR